jgi:hypothetical protein
MTAYTPGPWQLKDIPGGYLLKQEGPHGYYLFDLKEHSGLRQAEATARLIAAAPDMLKALQAMCLNMKNDGGDYRDCYKNARAAIAKATNGDAS